MVSNGIAKVLPEVYVAINLMFWGLINLPVSTIAQNSAFTLNIRVSQASVGLSSPTNHYVETADKEAWALNGRLFLDGTGKYAKAYFKMEGRSLVHDPSGVKVGYGRNNRLIRGGIPLEWTSQAAVYPNDPTIHNEIELWYGSVANKLITCSRFSPEIRVLPKSSINSFDLNGCLFVTLVVA